MAGNWMNGRKMGLGEAYSRADENAEVKPQPQFTTRWAERAAMRVRSASNSSTDVTGAAESRIPRSTAYSPGSSMVKSSPPKSLKGAYARAEAEEQAKIDARLARERIIRERADRILAEQQARAERERLEREQRVTEALGAAEYESESTGPRATSPSPAARPATRPAYMDHARPGSSRSSSSGSVGSNYNYPPRDPVKEAQWDANRVRNLEREARAKRVLANTKPIYLSNRSRHNASRALEAKALLEQKAAAEAAGEVWVPPPSVYGFKSRRTEGWMRRLIDPNDPMLALFDPPATSPDDERPASSSSNNGALALASSSSNEDAPRSASADIPRPSVEVGPSAQPTPPSSRPSSAQPKNGSPEKSKMWDADIDFTAHSLQESTSPLLRVKTSKLDDIRQREIESLTARAVATNRLEEIRERNSEERSTLSESSRVNSRQATPAPIKEPQEEVNHERTILEEEGEHIPNTPITIFAKGNYRPSSSSSGEDQDPEKIREESFEAIRLLARKMSPGPRRAERLAEESKQAEEFRNKEKKKDGDQVPMKDEMDQKAQKARNSEKVEDDEKKTKDEPAVKVQERRRKLEIDADLKRRSTTSTPPKSDVDPEERITAEAKLFELADNKSERNSIRAPSRSPSPSDDGKCDETPRPKADPLSLPTPRVTGAYIETPAPSTRKPRKSGSISPTYEIVNEINDLQTLSNNSTTQQSSRRTSAARSEQRNQQTRDTSSQPEITKQKSELRISRPALINTATPASVAEDLRSIAMEEQYEDSTLDDFENILESENTTHLNNTTMLAPIIDLEYNERGHPLSAEERERRIERLRLDRMNQQLKNTSFSIRDAKHGIERLEHQVAASNYTPTPVLDDQLYLQINLKIPVPRLVVATPIEENQGRFGWRRTWKFTWVGLILFLFGLWYVAESAMCSVYCHPKQSSRNTWHPSDPFFPWAIPTKIDQWTGKAGSNVLQNVVRWLDIGLNIRGTNGYMSANDWWEGRGGPAPSFRTDSGSMYDDEEYV
ncbi:hypothetical protein N431DRAFT_435954 [Stipitochalara longipes BDJ]|nr:hypothetical protein N431DRAFT_435954 [Stipitochalara longipes BDJ]